MENNEQSSLDIWSNLSSGTGEEDGDTIFSVIFDFLGSAADWAGDVSDLLGLL